MKEFLPYNESLSLKELHFDEPCFGYYTNDNKFHFINHPNRVMKNTQIANLYADEIDICSAPTFSGAFRFFREKYSLFISIDHYEDGYSINDLRRFKTYEEAELASIQKLIEIVKNYNF